MDRIVRARAFIRLTRYSDALSVISQTIATDPDEAAYLQALEATCHALLGSMVMARRALSGIPPGDHSPETQFEVAYAKMLLGWVESDADAMEHALNGVQLINSPQLYGQWLYARSWVAALRGDYVEQLRLLEKATTHIVETPEAYDAYLLASATRSLVHLVREISAPDTFDFAFARRNRCLGRRISSASAS